MRTAIPVVVFVVAGLVVPHVASAEKLRATMEAKVHARPGEGAKVIVTVHAGQTVHVIARKGRWIKVKVGRKRGWITRTSVERPHEGNGEPKPHKTAWGRRGDKAAKQLKATPARTAVLSAPAPVEAEASAGVAPVSAAPSAGRLHARAGAALGVAAMSREFSSNGATDGAVYDATGRAVGVGIDGAVDYRVGGPLLVGADAGYRFGLSDGGFRFTSDTGAEGDVPFSTHSIDVGVDVGLRYGERVEVGTRAGLHYTALLVSQLDNPGQLPHESLFGPTVGGRLRVADVAGRLSLAARFDRLLAGGRSQTPGLEDGDSADTSAWWAGATASYPLSSGLLLELRYAYGRETTSWAGAAARTGATEANRTDVEHLITVGLSRGL